MAMPCGEGVHRVMIRKFTVFYRFSSTSSSSVEDEAENKSTNQRSRPTLFMRRETAWEYYSRNCVRKRLTSSRERQFFESSPSVDLLTKDTEHAQSRASNIVLLVHMYSSSLWWNNIGYNFARTFNLNWCSSIFTARKHHVHNQKIRASFCFQVIVFSLLTMGDSFILLSSFGIGMPFSSSTALWLSPR